MFAGNGTDAIWCDDDGKIIVKTEEAANAVADLIETFYRSQGEEICINTGYYEPEGDERNEEKGERTGGWYVCVN